MVEAAPGTVGTILVVMVFGMKRWALGKLSVGARDLTQFTPPTPAATFILILFFAQKMVEL